MDFQQLKYFMVLDKSKHFTEASLNLHISQSSLSKHIKALEKELDVLLFKRTMKGCELTPEGKIFRNYAKEILSLESEMNEKILNSKRLKKETITIGTMPIMSEYNICDAVSDFFYKNPSLSIKIVESSDVMHLVKLMNTGELNISFLGTQLLNEDLFEEVTISNDSIVLIVSEKNDLANRECVSLKEISSETLILLDESTGWEEFIKHHYALSYNVMSGYTNTNTILSLVRDNLGITLLWEKLLKTTNMEGLHVIPLKEDTTSSVVMGIPLNTKLKKAEIKFVEFIKERYRSFNKQIEHIL